MAKPVRESSLASEVFVKQSPVSNVQPEQIGL